MADGSRQTSGPEEFRDDQVSGVHDGYSFVKVVAPTPDLLQVPRGKEDLSVENTGKYDNFVQEASEQ